MGLNATALTAVDAFTAAIYPPQAGTDVLAADVEAGEQVLLNRTLYLANHVVGDSMLVFADGDAGVNPALSVDTWNDLVISSDFQNSAVAYVDIPGCLAGDVLTLAFSGNFKAVNAAAGYNVARLLSIEDFGGANGLNTFDGYAAMYSGIATTYYAGVGIAATHVINTTGPARIMLQASIVGASGNQLVLTGGWSIVVTRVRP